MTEQSKPSIQSGNILTPVPGSIQDLKPELFLVAI